MHWHSLMAINLTTHEMKLCNLDWLFLLKLWNFLDSVNIMSIGAKSAKEFLAFFQINRSNQCYLLAEKSAIVIY